MDVYCWNWVIGLVANACLGDQRREKRAKESRINFKCDVYLLCLLTMSRQVNFHWQWNKTRQSMAVFSNIKLMFSAEIMSCQVFALCKWDTTLCLLKRSFLLNASRLPPWSFTGTPLQSAPPKHTAPEGWLLTLLDLDHCCWAHNIFAGFMFICFILAAFSPLPKHYFGLWANNQCNSLV